MEKLLGEETQQKQASQKVNHSLLLAEPHRGNKSTSVLVRDTRRGHTIVNADEIILLPPPVPAQVAATSPGG